MPDTAAKDTSRAAHAPWCDLPELLWREHGLDVSCYSEAFLASSCNRRLQSIPGGTADGLFDLLKKSRRDAESFAQFLQVHHSEFFREPLAYALLEQSLLPRIVNAKELLDYPEIRVWSAGCAAGEEAYSLAILLSELSERCSFPVRFRLFATDSSAEQLALACRGVYPASALGRVQQRHIDKWFTRQGEAYTVVEELRRCVDFSLHGLLDEHSLSPTASIFGGFDLVLCCNLLFYYRPASQERILKKLRRSMAAGGYLVTGEAEREVVQSSGFQPLGCPATIFHAAG